MKISLDLLENHRVPGDELIKSGNIKLRTEKYCYDSDVPLSFKLAQKETFLRSLTLPGLIWKEFSPQEHSDLSY